MNDNQSTQAEHVEAPAIQRLESMLRDLRNGSQNRNDIQPQILYIASLLSGMGYHVRFKMSMSGNHTHGFLYAVHDKGIYDPQSMPPINAEWLPASTGGAEVRKAVSKALYGIDRLRQENANRLAEIQAAESLAEGA